MLDTFEQDIQAFILIFYLSDMRFFHTSICRGVSISRVIDNKHHPADIIGGAFLGTVIGGAFILRAIPRHFVVIPEEEVDDGYRQNRYQQQQQPLLAGGNDANNGGVTASSISRLDNA
jgi:membrane-associated phospholipid phosphatase